MLIGTIRGSFDRVSGTVLIDPNSYGKSSVKAVIDVASLHSGFSKRDKWLLSRAFFDVARFPTITFESHTIHADSHDAKQDRFIVIGDLTMHGIKKQITLETDPPTEAVNDQKQRPIRALVAFAKLDRKDFELRWNDTLQGGGTLIGDDVSVEINLELIRAPEPALNTP